MFEALKAHHEKHRDRRITDLFDPARAQDFSVGMGDLLLDYSKTTIDAEARAMLIDLLEARSVAARCAAMFTGARINETEDRAVLHTALRNLDGGPVLVGGRDVMPGVRQTLERMETFATDLRAGRIAGQGGPITDVINIGIGGSDLGPAMAVRALAPYHDGPRCHFVSNVDPSDIADALRACDPARTLVIVASKTFTTIETMSNARTARAWMGQTVADPAAQFVALSSDPDRTDAFGIPPEQIFNFKD